MNNWFACNNKYPCAEVVRTSCGYGTQYFWFQHTCRRISVLYLDWFWLELLIFCSSAIIIYCILEYLWGVNFWFLIYFRLLMCKIIDFESIFFVLAVTPRNRAQSAPPSRSGRTGHDLWMSAVKQRETGQWQTQPNNEVSTLVVKNGSSSEHF